MTQSSKVGPLQDKVSLSSAWFPFQPFLFMLLLQDHKDGPRTSLSFPQTLTSCWARNLISSGKLEQIVGGGTIVMLQRNGTFCQEWVLVKGMF